jgi:trehalose 6-phosphate phosphatase
MAPAMPRPTLARRLLGRSRALPAPPPLAAGCALFLDVDGTLLDLAPTPSAVHVDAAIASLLPALSVALDGAVALVTGRAITDADRLFPGLRLPIAGQHGCERRDAAGVLHLHAPARATMAKLRALLAGFAAQHPGVLLEDKGATLAVHYRLAPDLAAEVRRTVQTGVAGASSAGLVLQPGKQLIEVRPDNRDKGTAIRDFMREPPFAGRRAFFVGDDAGDEHGFSVVQRMPGGVAVKVGPGRTRAKHRLDAPADVRRWLSTIVPQVAHPAAAAPSMPVTHGAQRWADPSTSR